MTQTIIQGTTPDEYRGRVMGLFMINNGLTPLGTLIFGAIAEVFGVKAAIILAGAGGMASVTLILLRFPIIRSYQSAPAPDEGTATAAREPQRLRAQPSK